MDAQELKSLTRQVLQNCDISDAYHSGLYSICGLALRLRDLYKWEKQLPPWEERDSSEILDWIDAKETRWEVLAEMIMRNCVFSVRNSIRLIPMGSMHYWNPTISTTAPDMPTALNPPFSLRLLTI